MEQTTTVIRQIANLLFGYKYYANIVNTRGVVRPELCSYIFRTREEAEAHRRGLSTNVTFEFLETVSFRSRNPHYLKVTNPLG